VIASGRRLDPLHQLARETGCSVLGCDLATRDSLEPLLEAAASVDILVCNAALPAAGLIDDFKADELDRILDVNLRVPILLSWRAAAAMTRRGGGHIVLIGSMGAKLITRGMSLYGGTKSGLRGFGLGLREDLRPHGVGVSVVSPGPILDVGMWADAAIAAPRGVRPSQPDAVGAAVVDAVLHDRAEIDIASRSLRLGAVLAFLKPQWFATVQRRVPNADEILEKMTLAARGKR